MKSKLKSFIYGSLAVLTLSQSVITTVSAESKNPNSSDGRWMSGEYHVHTVQSNDVSEPSMKLENVLNAAFRENIDQLPTESVARLSYGKPFDFIVLTDHLRNSPRDPDGNDKPTARWEAIQDQLVKINELQAAGKYAGKLIYPGFEWDMMGLDHVQLPLSISKAILYLSMRSISLNGCTATIRVWTDLN